VRHSRSQAFADALPAARSGESGNHWSSVADDPNDPHALAMRASVLRQAWIPEIPNRVGFLLERCKDKRVLDIGCVAHDLARMDAANWLHGQIAGVAASCLGVDIHGEGVSEMRRRGFQAIEHDLAQGLGPLDLEKPFDVIVAGELIEHVESMGITPTTSCLRSQVESPNWQVDTACVLLRRPLLSLNETTTLVFVTGSRRCAGGCEVAIGKPLDMPRLVTLVWRASAPCLVVLGSSQSCASFSDRDDAFSVSPLFMLFDLRKLALRTNSRTPQSRVRRSFQRGVGCGD